MTDDQQQPAETPDAPKVYGYARVHTMRGLVFDCLLIAEWQSWYKMVKADGAVFTPICFIPWHAIDSVAYSPTPFPATLGTIAPAGSA